MYKRKLTSILLCVILCLQMITPATAEVVDGDEAIIQVTAITDSSTADCDIDADNTLPSPFNAGHPDNMVMIALKEDNQSKYRTAYCIEFGKKATDDDELIANYDKLTLGVKRVVNYALLEGFYKEFSASDFGKTIGRKWSIVQQRSSRAISPATLFYSENCFPVTTPFST